MGSRIAFIAVSATGADTGEPEAIVVGTMPSGVSGWKEGDWRYARYPWRELHALLAENRDPLGADADASVEKEVETIRPLDKEQTADASEVVEKTFLNSTVTVQTPSGPKTIPRLSAALPILNIERIFWFTFEEGETAVELAKLAPFCVLDTATASRAVLFPELSGDTRRGALAALALHPKVDVAVNGHRLAGSKEKKAEDRDHTRMLLDLGVVRRPQQSLWVVEGGGMPAQRRGACFDTLKLRCTLGPSIRKRWRSNGALRSRTDLLSLTEPTTRDATRLGWIIQSTSPPTIAIDGGVQQGADDYLINLMPALEALGLEPLKGSFPLANRELAFRRCDAPGEPPRIVWRFETTTLHIVDYGRTFAKSAAVTGVLPVQVDRDGKPVTLASVIKDVAVMFAEEQRVDDVKLDFSVHRTWHTVLTARLKSLDGDAQERKLQAAVTGYVTASSNQAIAKVHEGLKVVRDGRPISLLPLLSAPEHLAWHAVGLVTHAGFGRRLSDGGNESPRLLVGIVSFEPVLALDLWNPTPEPPDVAAVAALPRFTTIERTAPHYDVKIRAPRGEILTEGAKRQPLVTAEPDAAERGTRFTIELIKRKPAASNDSREVAVGALQLTLGEAFKKASTFDREGQLTLHVLDRDAGEDRRPPIVAVGGTIIVPIDSVDPAGQDDVAGASSVSARLRRRRTLAPEAPDPTAPLLFPLDAPPGAATLTLASEEAVTRDRDHTIALSVRAVQESNSTPGMASTGRLLVIDPRPFRVAAVAYAPISRSASSQSNQVAVWNESGEGGLSWRVRDEGQSISLTLPPQAVGEAMEKNRSGTLGLPSDVEPGRPSAARFGSATLMRIDPTFADTRFREPGWNLRRILGSALQRAPGARLLELRLELLYGLLAKVRTDGMWITELAGAIGEPPLPIASDDSKADHLTIYTRLVNTLLDAERYRLAVDKLYRDRPDEYLRFEDGVSFRIRRRVRDESGAIGGPVTPLRWPIAGDIPRDTGGLINVETLARTFSTSPADADAFPGGLPWAFESANILMSVFGRPVSDGGNLGGVYLSAHGGYGSQRALFDNRRSIVETETTQGRVQRYRLERVGRIGGLWHPAKHVIVYERTVVPSGQFFNAPPIGLRQDEHAGRAIPRKVEEYVEILKPVRRYPEDGSSIRACGFLVGAEFKSIRIRVDSAWGADVRREGWKVPLWNNLFEAATGDADSDPDDPANQYPKPQIRVIAAGRSGEVTCEIDEPEKLVFYTSVVPSEDDQTDRWAPVRGVDFCDLPRPTVGSKAPSESADLTDAILPPEPAHVPGYEPFTIGLVASKEPVSLAHGRADGGPVAALRNITIARAVPVTVSPDKESPTLRYGRELTTLAADVRGRVDRVVGRTIAVLEQVDQATQPEELQRLLKQAAGALDPKQVLEAKEVSELLKRLDLSKPDLSNLCKDIRARAEAEIDGTLARFRAAADALFSAVSADILARVAQGESVAKGELARLDAILVRADALVARLANVKDLADDARRQLVAELRALAATARATINGFADDSTRAVAANVAAVVAGLDALQRDVEGDIRTIRGRTKANFDAIRQLVGAMAKQGADSAKATVDQAVAQIDASIAALDEAIKKGGVIDQAVKSAASDAAKQLTIASDAVTRARRVVAEQKAHAPVVTLLEKLERSLTAALTLARELEQAGIGEQAKPWRDKMAQARSELRAAGDTVNAKVDDLENAIKTVMARLEQILDAADKQVGATLAAAIAQKKAIVDALNELPGRWEKQVKQLAAKVKAAVTTLEQELAKLGNSIEIPATLVKAAETLAVTLHDEIAALRAIVAVADAVIGASSDALERAIRSGQTVLTGEIDRATQQVRVAAVTLLDRLQIECDLLIGELKKIADDLTMAIGKTLDLDGLKKRLESELPKAVEQAAQTIAEIKQAVAAKAAELAREAEARVREVTGELQQSVRDALGADLETVAQRAEGIYQKGDTALHAIRALGDPPKTDSLGFNRPEVAYVLGEASKLGIDMTPALALVNRAADQMAAAEKAGKAVGELLDSFGVRLPVNELADQLIPQKLKNLSVADLLPDIAGIDFRGLLQRVAFPDLDDSNAVKLRHGFDKVERRAWMEADLDVPFAQAVPLLSFGPVQIVIDTARFTSHARLTAGVDGVQRQMNGRIFGDWRVVSGGQTILTFRQTGLYFDDSGRIDFRIQPDRVELAAALQFVTDLMKATGQKGGLRVQPFMRGGIPSGVAATLDMALPPIQTGAFGVSDLSLHVLFGIAALPRFEIVSELAVGSRLAPFTLNIWILNGGGYVTQRLSFLPAVKPKPLLTYTLDISILVGLGIGFSFGVVSGGVWLQVGCGIALTWTTGSGGNTTAVRVFLLARGCVDVAGLITASITLLFEVIYDGDRLIGAGTLSIRVKISVFFELSIDEHVEYVFAGEKKQVESGSYADSYC
jgi:hypothetical protein